MTCGPAMEPALGKLVMDVGFRDTFFRDAMAASRAAGIELTDDECTVLARIRPGALAAFPRYLDGRWIGRRVDEGAHHEPGRPRAQRNG